ncbi:MAG: hypothetical protein IT381_27865 [Deltaproteobacteria bacterium]|nr:hypothetical protein [Deltaproteobacteria bacterium]
MIKFADPRHKAEFLSELGYAQNPQTVKFLEAALKVVDDANDKNSVIDIFEWTFVNRIIQDGTDYYATGRRALRNVSQGQNAVDTQIAIMLANKNIA